MIDAEARTIEFCRELVRLESVSGDERAVADAVEREMRALGYDETERDEMGSVVGIARGSAPGATVLFDAHMDVVPATEPGRWRFAPFSGERAEGRVWGRGATDVKGSLAALVVAIGTLPRADVPGTILVSASVGEERIEGLAVSAILERRPAQAAVICEPTNLALGLGHRGRASLVLEAEGKAAHTSRPENGVNAVYRLIEAIARVRAMRRPEDGLLGHGSIELVEISSEPFPGSSMVPFRAIARFDRRLVRGETRDGVLAELRPALAGLDGLSLRLNEGTLDCYTGRSLRVPAFHSGWAVEPGAEIARQSARALADAGLPHEIFYAPYCTNGTATAGERGLPTLIYGAGEIGAAHAMDESVAEEQLVGALRGYQALARWLGR
jgi:putative selenium metabolism hydrolase